MRVELLLSRNVLTIVHDCVLDESVEQGIYYVLALDEEGNEVRHMYPVSGISSVSVISCEFDEDEYGDND